VAKGHHPPGAEAFDATLPEGFELEEHRSALEAAAKQAVGRSSAMARSSSCGTYGRRTRTTRRGLSRRRSACRWRELPSGLGARR